MNQYARPIPLLAIDWSFELCSPEEQLMWARMSVFPGGFGLEAAGRVYGPDDLDGATVLDVVAGLVDKSVVIRQNGTFGWHGWYRMLETIREYGEAKLAGTGAESEVRARQVEHYVDLARRYRAEEFGPRQLKWLGRLQHEHANLRAVLEYCLSRPERARDVLDIASSLMSFWCRGLMVEGYRYLAVCGAAAYGYEQRGEALGLQQDILARGLVAQADATQAVSPELSLRLALAADHLNPGGDARSSIVKVLTSSNYARKLTDKANGRVVVSRDHAHGRRNRGRR